jgi:hypothetical protein
MPKLKWKDVSSYSRSDLIREPNTYYLECKGLRICVFRHIDEPKMWRLSCYELHLGIGRPRPLSPDLETAQLLALKIVDAQLTTWSKAVEKARAAQSREEARKALKKGARR